MRDVPAAARPAFTLVELLVVVALIGVLVSLLLPSLASARRAARGTACLAGLRSIGQAVHMYADANGDRFPVSSHTAGSLVARGAWLSTLEEYGVDRRARRCGLDESAASKLTSYASNEHFEPLTPGLDFNPFTRQALPGGRRRAYDRLTQVPRPSRTIYVLEPEGDGTADHINTHAFGSAADVRAAVAATRHSGAAAYLFVDGHAAVWAWSEFAPSFSAATSPFNPETAR